MQTISMAWPASWRPTALRPVMVSVPTDSIAGRPKLAMDQHALAHAEAMFDAALSYAPDDPVVRFDLLAEQSRVFYSSLQLERWRSNLDEQEALLASLPQPDPHLSLNLHVNFSHYFRITGEGEAAVEAALAAVAIAKQLEDREALALAYQELANGYWIESRMAEAKPLFGQSAALCPRCGECDHRGHKPGDVCGERHVLRHAVGADS